MKRFELVEKLINEGMSEKTLSKLTDKQLDDLAVRMLGEETVMISKTSPTFQKDMDAAKKAKKTIETYEEHGVGSKVTKGHNGIPEFMDSKKLKEEKPSAGLSKEKKSEVAKKAKKGEDIGKKGKGFEKIADKAAKKYGSKEKGEKVAAAAMWKNVQREEDETKNWVKNLAEEKFFHILTSKNEIMEMIDSKINEVNNNKFPDMFKWDSLKSMNGEIKESGTTTKPAPVKPKVDPGTKPKNPVIPKIVPKQRPKAETNVNEGGTKIAPVKPKVDPDTKPKNPVIPKIIPKQRPKALSEKKKD
jgi:hypothetical protein